jgi:hypothetical protein
MALAIGSLLLMTAACALTGGVATVDSEVIVGPGYYEPYGAVYGGWGAGYHVGPMARHAPLPPEPRRDHPVLHTFRPPPAARPAPSLPSRPRGVRTPRP